MTTLKTPIKTPEDAVNQLFLVSLNAPASFNLFINYAPHVRNITLQVVENVVNWDQPYTSVLNAFIDINDITKLQLYVNECKRLLKAHVTAKSLKKVA
jgi:hypothetical protein